MESMGSSAFISPQLVAETLRWRMLGSVRLVAGRQPVTWECIGLKSRSMRWGALGRRIRGGCSHRARAPSRWRLLRPPRRPVSLCVGCGRGGKLRIRRRISTTVNGFQMCPERAEKHALRASETERSMFLDRPKGWELP